MVKLIALENETLYMFNLFTIMLATIFNWVVSFLYFFTKASSREQLVGRWKSFSKSKTQEIIEFNENGIAWLNGKTYKYVIENDWVSLYDSSQKKVMNFQFALNRNRLNLFDTDSQRFNFKKSISRPLNIGSDFYVGDKAKYFAFLNAKTPNPA